ncbi:MAG: MogA/MoaB family molybdenum cofactor biosynthesis protein [Planctomycetota bacterium]
MADALDPPMRVAVLTVSDRCSRGAAADTSGPALEAMCRLRLSAEVVARECCADEVKTLAEALRRWCLDAPKPDLLLTTGGTGLAPRDVTPEATASVLERRHPALLELARRRCYDITPRTYLSRGESGTLGSTLILNLPGSERGATEMLTALLDILPHAVETLRGDVQDDGRPEARPDPTPGEQAGDGPRAGRIIHHPD